MADDELTQREKRAQRHKVESRKSAPGRMARKAALPLFLLLLVAAVATGFWYTSTHQPDCPTHWHGTFGVFLPGEENASQPMEVNFRSPYYDISSGKMPERAHMHQGDGFNQMHFEQAGTCVGVKEWMKYVEVRVSSTSIELFGHHADLGQDGTWKASGSQQMHAWVEACVGAEGPKCEGGTWTWEERSVKSVLDYQMKDGEKLLLYIGDFTPAQVQQMKDSIHDPVSRQAGFTATQGVHPTASRSPAPAPTTSSSSSTNSTA
jgi:hypothetical protein